MSHPAIKVEGLCKRYVLGKNERAGSFREAVTQSLSAPFRRLRSVKDGGGDQEFWALKDVNFEVQPGEVVGVIGRNGAGKSTLLKILSRITPPTSGSIRLRGRVASLLEVGTGFHPELTGRENIYLNGAMLGMRREEITRKFDEIVAFSEVEKFLDTPVKRYSSGMYVRLAFAVAAHLEPEILIVDEVLAVGDAAFQKKCLGKMKAVSASDGRTVLFVSHNIAAVKTLCTRGVVMDRGQAVYYGDARHAIELYDDQSPVLQPSVSSRDIACGDFNILSLTFCDDSGRLDTHRDAKLTLRLRSQTDCSDVAAHIYLEDSDGTMVSGLDSRDFGLNATCDAEQEFKIVFSIRRLPLLPGAYRVRVVLRNDTTFESFDCPHLFPFEVSDNFSYGTRSISRQYHGTLAIDLAS
jgi:lipopolysaccharide transport system ATP-binding protein